MADNTWHQFLDDIRKAKEKLKFEKNEECFYRGHPDNTWHLSPGLFRDMPKTKNNLITRDRWWVESDLYYEFRSRARVLHNNSLTDWDVLFFMQHHGVKTRLLDWSESLGPAIYFALIGCKKPGYGQPCIWLLNPYGLNEKFHDGRELWSPENLDTYNPKYDYSYEELLLGGYEEEGGEMFYWDEPVAIYPNRRGDRLTNQGGYFTIHGNNVLPINKMKGNEDYVVKVDLPKAAIDSALEFLELSGINHFTLFPDLDGLAKYLNSKYF